MPNRILREGILTSDRVDSLDAAAEVFYRRLMSKVDDHGLYDGRPAILRANLYPLRVDRVREADISRWIAACEKAGLIALYQVDGKPYLQMLDTKWIARTEPKYPKPPPDIGASLRASANNCAQVQTDARLVVDVVGDVVVEKLNTLSAHADPKDEKPSPRNGNNGHGSRLPDGWSLPDDWRDWAVKVHHLEPQKAVRLSLAFRDYWYAKPGKEGRKADWQATWRNWVRKAVGDA